MTGATILYFPHRHTRRERIPVGGCDIDIHPHCATCGYSASYIEYADDEGEYVARLHDRLLGTFATLWEATTAIWDDAAASYGVYPAHGDPVPESLGGGPTEPPSEMPQWATDLGFCVFRDDIEGVWVAAHLAPHGAHGATYAAYRTKAEAVARCIREAGR